MNPNQQNKGYSIFEQWYKTMQYILDRCDAMPKHTRFTISGRIVNLSIENIELITEAIYTKDRNGLLLRLNMNLEKLRIFVRLSKDRSYISLAQYEYLSEAINTTGKMVGGWLKEKI